MVRSLLLLVVLALVAASVAACGGTDDKDAYRTGFAPVNQDIVATGTRVGEALRGAGKMKNDAQVAAVFATLASETSHTAGTLAALKPSDGLADEQTALVAGLRRAAGSLGRISQAAVDGDARAARSATTGAQASAARIREPRRRIAAQLGLD